VFEEGGFSEDAEMKNKEVENEKLPMIVNRKNRSTTL